MKIGVAQYIGVRFFVGTLIGLATAAFVLWQAFEALNGEATRFAGNNLAGDVRKTFDDERKALIRALQYSNRKDFRATVEQGDELGTSGHLISLTNILLPREVMLYVNRGDENAWVNSGEIFDLGDSQPLIKSLEPIFKSGASIASLPNFSHKDDLYLLISTPIQGLDGFDIVGDIQAVFAFGDGSTLLDDVMEDSSATCIILIPKNGDTASSGPADCVQTLEQKLKQDANNMATEPELVGSWYTTGTVRVSDGYSFRGDSFIAARKATSVQKKIEYANLTILFVGGCIVMSGFFVTFFVGAKIRRDIQSLVSFVGQELKDPSWKKPDFKIAEFQRLSDAHDDAQKKLVAEQQTREEAEVNVVRLHGELSSAQVEKMQALGHLTAGVAHDFNNLLAIIHVGVSQLTDRVEFSSGSPKEAVIEAINRATAVVQDLLFYSRNDSNFVEVNDMADMVRRVEKVMRAAIGPEIQLSTQIDPETDYLVKIDSGKCFSALTNLVKNSKDAMPKGGSLIISLTGISQREAAKEGVIGIFGACVVSVKDTGEGIPEDILQSVLRPYFTTKQKLDGTGLGLSLTETFVADSGGKINISSEVGKGTRIELIIPLTDEILASNEINVLDAPNTPTEKRQVLLVEDETSLAKITRIGLEKMNIDVEIVGLVSEALDRISQKDYDCIITDLRLPDGNGSEILTLMDSIGKRTPVIILSGNPTFEEIEEFAERPLTSVYTKPISISQLAKAVMAFSEQLSDI